MGHWLLVHFGADERIVMLMVIFLFRLVLVLMMVPVPTFMVVSVFVVMSVFVVVSFSTEFTILVSVPVHIVWILIARELILWVCLRAALHTGT